MRHSLERLSPLSFFFAPFAPQLPFLAASGAGLPRLESEVWRQVRDFMVPPPFVIEKAWR
jgi:hypothetical protein